MIEKIYRNKYMVTCDNCGEGEEFDSWTDALEYMFEEGWRKKLVGGEWVHYCKEMSTAQRVSLKIIKNKIKRTLTLLTVLRLSPIAYKKEIRELEEKLERYRQKYIELKVKELRGKRSDEYVNNSGENKLV